MPRDLDNRKNNNPSGKNQHGSVPGADDPTLRDALIQLHREGVTNNKTMSSLLLSRFGIVCNQHTVKRRRHSLRLFSSKKTTQDLPEEDKMQMVLAAMADDPLGQRGPRTIKRDIALNTGLHLTRDFVSEVMHQVAPEGFQTRKPVKKDATLAEPGHGSDAKLQ